MTDTLMVCVTYHSYDYVNLFKSLTFLFPSDYKDLISHFSFSLHLLTALLTPLKMSHRVMISETSDCKAVTGSYSVVLPDGRKKRTQIVNYKVDAYSGYVAEVKYEGVAHYSEYKAPAEY